MSRRPPTRSPPLRLETLETRLTLAAPAAVAISEFMSANDTTLTDEDGAYSDWIELHNTTAAPVSLNGWYLTDNDSNLTKWQIPDVALAADGYLVIFASNKDRRVPGSNLHTNFRIDADGEFLALVHPDGATIEHSYPAVSLQADVSYGIGEALLTDTLVDTGASAKFLVPTATNPVGDWRSVGFDDSSWATVATGVGYQNVAGGTAAPVGYWTFDDTPNDFSGNNSTATLFGAATYSAEVPSQIGAGKSLSLTGANGTYAVVNPMDVSETAMSVSFWFQGASVNRGLFTVAQGNLGASANDRSLYLSGSNIAAQLKPGITAETIGSTGRTYTDNAWHHLVYAFEQGVSAQRVYIDGAQVAAGVQSFSINTGQDRIYIGFAPQALTDYWSGRIDDVAVFTGLLTPTQVTALYNGASPLELQSYTADIATNIGGSMSGVNPTSYLRIPFTVADLSIYDGLKLKIKYDDGFSAYLNGTEIARRNAPATLAWDSAATAVHSNAQATQFEDIDLSANLASLTLGSNVLAIQGLNISASNVDFLLSPKLVDEDLIAAIEQYYTAPTPGGVNNFSGAEVVADPLFSRASSIITAATQIGISTFTSGATIRYTTNGSVPSEASTLYTGPINVTSTTQIRARAFKSGARPSAPVTRNFVALDASVADFESNLPIIVLDTFGVGGTKGTGLDRVNYTYAAAVFIDASPNGRAHILDDAQFAGRSGLRRRGLSAAGFPKPQFALETRNEIDQDLAVSVLGFPADSDWILKNPYTEKTLLNEVLASQWGRETGQYGPRARFVEVFVNGDGDARISYDEDYAGIYALVEKIKIGDDRVDIAKLRPYQNGEPEVSGGYIWKFDHADANEVPWRSVRGYEFRLHDPDDDEVTAAQKQWLINYVNEFETALYGPQYTDPVNGFRKYTDVDSWINEWLLVELFKGVESFQTGMYFYKDRGGKIEMGPLWDVNGALGNGNYGMAGHPTGWRYDLLNDSYLTYWRRLYSDLDFRQRMIDRWAELRRTVFATDKVLTDMDALVTLLSDGKSLHERILPGQPSNPLSRNYTEYPILDEYTWPNCYYPGAMGDCPRDAQGQPLYPPPQVYDDHLRIQKDFVTQRMAWMDGQFLAGPLFSHSGGIVLPGQTVTLTTPAAEALIYYTTDGSDPRAPGGGIGPAARLYTGPILLDANTKIVARSYKAGTVIGSVSTNWSAPTDALFITTPTPLVVTEINFNPGPPSATEQAAGVFDNDEFEFIELANVGDAPLDMAGIQFTDGIEFAFPAMTLPAGDHALVVKSQAAYELRYGAGHNIAGVYSGSLANEGERIAVATSLGEVPIDFTYDDDWYALTDGEGYTLTIDDWLADPQTWSDKASWRPSDYALGSPDSDDAGLAPPQGSLKINEILTNATATGDRIEIYNSTAAPISINRFYLSDDPFNPTKYRLPISTPSVPAGGFLALDAKTYFGGAFNMSLDGGTLLLHAADAAGNLIGFRTTEDFGAALPDTTLGRYPKSDGTTDFVELVSNTLGAANSPPRVGPIVINELLYRPAAGDDEYIELLNITSHPIFLNGWSLHSAVNYAFGDTTLAAGEFLIVSLIDPAAFRAKYSVPADVQIVGPYLGVLDDYDPNGESVELYQPGSGTTPVLVDRVRYFSSAPWPTATSGLGLSLARVQPSAYGNDAIYWRTGIPGGTAGTANLFYDATGPSKPGAPTATVLADQSVVLNWTPSVDPETGVAQYRILRNNADIGISATPNFIDRATTLNTAYWYSIVAQNPSGVPSPPSNLTPLRILTLTGASRTDPTHFRVTFSEGVSASSAQNVANYTVTGAILTSAVLEADGLSVILGTLAPITEGAGYRLVTSNIVGAAAGSVVLPNMQRTILVGIANGLRGEYYDDPAASFGAPPPSAVLGTKVGERFDAAIIFFWAFSPLFAPALPATAADTLGVRWTGRLLVPVTGSYTFSFNVFTAAGGDGVRFWIDANHDGMFEDIASELIVNAWPATTPTQSGTINLVGGQTVPIRIDFYENTGQAQITMRWQYPGQATLVTVPTANLLTPTFTDIEGPNVTHVKLGSSGWTPAFLSQLQAAGFGAGGITVPLGGSTPILPWTNLNQVSITFDEDVNVGQDGLLVNGVNAASYGVAGFDYDYATYTATWTLANPLPNDRVTVSLAGSAVDLVGNPVEGVAGATFLALPGDVNQSGAVDQADFRASLDRQFSGIGSAGYSVLHDTDGNGAINIQDWQNVRRAIGDSLPPPPSPAPTAEAIMVTRTGRSTRGATAGLPSRATRPATLRTSGGARLSQPAIDQIIATPAESPTRTLQASRSRRAGNAGVNSAALDEFLAIG